MKVYNVLTRKKETFRPINEGKVGMYVCGPTVYDYCHLGHAKGYVSMDFIRRYLLWKGLDVEYVQNFTDVGHLTDDADMGEDKIEKKAKQDKIDPMALVEKYINSYYEDFRKLNVMDADFAPRPSQEIPEIIEFTEELIKMGYAYESNGSVYFSVKRFKDYGKLSGRKIDELLSGARVDVRTEKKNPLDFALWIKAEPGHILKWDSPWSVGYPGWHIECSVMSKKYLGETFDIHGGGIENIFPHNESEIAQSEALTGKQMANYWLLWNMVMVNSEKMGKSKGNFTTIQTLLEKNDPMVVRLAIFKSHYRSILDFKESMFEEATNNLSTIHENIRALLKIATAKPKVLDLAEPIDVNHFIKGYRKLFISAMDDDFNTPLAFKHLFNFFAVVLNNDNLRNFTKEDARKLLKFLYEIDNVLGLNLIDIRELEIPNHVQTILDERKTARESKDWTKSDELRDRLRKEGYEVEDSIYGQIIKQL